MRRSDTAASWLALSASRMTSRERVLRAIDRRGPDQVPADFEANARVEEALIGRLGVENHEELLQALHVDMRRIQAPFHNPDPGPDALGYYRSVWGVRERAADRDDGRPMILPIFNEHTTVDDVHAHPWPEPRLLDAGIRGECEKHRGEYALYGAPWVPFFHEAARCIGQENFYVMMTSAPEVIHALIDHIVF
jgi:hypothetical protein